MNKIVNRVEKCDECGKELILVYSDNVDRIFEWVLNCSDCGIDYIINMKHKGEEYKISQK